jgi:hypothetical protein
MNSRRLPPADPRALKQVVDLLSRSSIGGDAIFGPVLRQKSRASLTDCCVHSRVDRVRSRSTDVRRSATTTHSVKRRVRAWCPSFQTAPADYRKFMCGSAENRANGSVICSRAIVSVQLPRFRQRIAGRTVLKRAALSRRIEHFLHALHCDVALASTRIAETRGFFARARGNAVAPSSGMTRRRKNPHAIALGRLGGLKGGHARAAKLSARRRSSIARHAAAVRWGRTS